MSRQPVAGNARTDAPTATVQSVTSSATVVTLLVANDERMGAYIENDCDKACYVKFGSAATTSSYTKKLEPKNANNVGGGFNVADVFSKYTGIITAIWDAAPTGAARITEY